MGSDTCMGIYTASKWASLDLNPSLALTSLMAQSGNESAWDSFEETKVRSLAG